MEDSDTIFFLTTCSEKHPARRINVSDPIHYPLQLSPFTFDYDPLFWILRLFFTPICKFKTQLDSNVPPIEVEDYGNVSGSKAED
ncbi:hypothetical protein SDJN03_28059, partial [Cucurbita argyrosperma subsp. sororia]